MGLPYTAKSVTRPPDHDAPFWVGCGTVLEPVRANAAKSFEPTRVYHIAWGSGGFLAARRARAAPGAACGRTYHKRIARCLRARGGRVSQRAQRNRLR